MSELPVYDIIEELGKDGEIKNSILLPTSAFDSKYQNFLASNDVKPSKSVTFASEVQVKEIEQRFEEFDLEPAKELSVTAELKKIAYYPKKETPRPLKQEMFNNGKQLRSLDKNHKTIKASKIGIPNVKPYYLQEAHIKQNPQAEKSKPVQAEEDVAEPLRGVSEARHVILEDVNETKGVKETQYPTTTVDFQAINDDLDQMVNAYVMGLYEDDIGIEYDMPNSIIERTEDLGKYNEQVKIVEEELKKEDEKNLLADKRGVEKEEKMEPDQPLFGDIVERSFEERLNDYHVEDDSDSDYGLNSEILNQEIAQDYQNLRQYLIGQNVGFRKQETEFEAIDEYGNPTSISKFKSTQITSPFKNEI